ncbi:hypothetical protein [Kitasatospora mediocidica]|uniref:hypothetical protein n=1 Tax=Kitasatospora mediocidica TaxID=58352 RepID=UPI0012FBF802|nr:hypothetical protein [Kitasatospora mediocidica]
MATTFADTFTARLNISKAWTREQAGLSTGADRAATDALWRAVIDRTNAAAAACQDSLPEGERLSRDAFDSIAAAVITTLRRELGTALTDRSGARFMEATAWLAPGVST